MSDCRPPRAGGASNGWRADAAVGALRADARQNQQTAEVGSRHHSVGTTQNHVVNIEQAGDIGGDARFLQHFAGGGITGAFARLDVAAWERPEPAHGTLAALDHQHATAAKNDGTGGGPRPRRGRRGGRHQWRWRTVMSAFTLPLFWAI